ncbi:MAG: dihydroorotase [Gammaproteobacteria bacterium]|nr:dihydroorotase [Gammaproteobacteria bacterium]
MRIRISHGRIIDPASGVDSIQDLYIAAGCIVALGRAPAGFSADRTLDAQGLIVCPGLIDLRAQLREPGEEHKATIASETRAAAQSGITTLCCPPATTPVVDTPAVVNLIRNRARQIGLAKVLPLGALTRGLDGQQLTEMRALKEAGCPGVSNDLRPLANLLVLRRAMEYAATHDLTLFLQPEDAALANSGCVHEGPVATRLGLPGIPAMAETTALASMLALAEQTGARCHFQLLTTERAVQMIAEAQAQGLPVTADVSAYHLQLTDLDVLDFDSLCHVRPPLRSQRDRDALRNGLGSHVLAAICSDHQPHEADAKLAPFVETAPGISGLETLLPLALKLVDQNILSLSAAIATITTHPAQILRLQDGGTLSPGQPADVCIFDPLHYWTLDPHHMHSRGHNTPFLDWELKGRVVYTLLDGVLIHERGAILE